MRFSTRSPWRRHRRDDPEATGLALAKVLSNLAETAPAALSIVTAARNGASILVHREESGDENRRLNVAYTIRIDTEVEGRTVERLLRLDAGFAILGRDPPAPQTYEAVKQPWYVLAANVPQAVTTPLYPFRTGRHYGFTLSRRTADDPGRIFGIDIRLDSLSESLQRALAVPGEHVAIFSPDGALLGNSDTLQIDRPLDAAASPDLATIRGPAHRHRPLQGLPDESRASTMSGSRSTARPFTPTSPGSPSTAPTWWWPARCRRRGSRLRRRDSCGGRCSFKAPS